MVMLLLADISDVTLVQSFATLPHPPANVGVLQHPFPCKLSFEEVNVIFSFANVKSLSYFSELLRKACEGCHPVLCATPDTFLDPTGPYVGFQQLFDRDMALL